MAHMLGVSTLLVASICVFVPVAIAVPHYTPDWESIDSRPNPSWFDEAKFGIFIHWGVFSVPSWGHDSEWYWDFLESGEKDFVEFHKKTYGENFKYEDFAPMFQAKMFDPARWAKMFKRAGAKYILLTSKHHEGFTMWPSDVAWNWNAMDVGPHRDLVGDLATAVRQEGGLTFGLYHSLYEWFNPWYVEDKKNHWQTRQFPEKKTFPELRDVVERYRPDVIWSDGAWEVNDTYWRSEEFLAWLYNDSPVKDTVVVNDRWCLGCSMKHGGFFTGLGNREPGPGLLGLGHKWEYSETLDKGSWGYNRASPLSNYVTAGHIVQKLISSVAFGGNYVINVSPTADGLILPLFEERLAQIGDYLEVNGEAIYGTTPHAEKQNATIPGGVEAYLTSKADAEYLLTVGWPDFTRDLEIPLIGVTAGLVLGRSQSTQVSCVPDGDSSKCVLPLSLALSGTLDPQGLVVQLTREGMLYV